MTPAAAARRGDMCMVDFSSPIGAEAAFERPAVIVSNIAANESASATNRGVVAVVPVTSNIRRVHPLPGQAGGPRLRFAARLESPGGTGPRGRR